ncbi:hypothetical protein [Mycoplasmopsis cynos]|uniref:hypothetical protein n=1 Tax=Mycoplasmopsis cynos TaxID=171284 RepID=UPI0024C71D9C|nr:hypothetical protein [Mycoplasmopsis cynos]WAM04948.1 hypothetical protein ONA01_02040 [Mycoplasmopsis cynos]
MQMEITIRKLQEYLKNRYKDRNDSVRLLTKLIEEVGEVAEICKYFKVFESSLKKMEFH